MSVTDAPGQKTSRVPFETEPGRPHPLGATIDKEGVNFSSSRGTRRGWSFISSRGMMTSRPTEGE
jgi:hypothetical protein